MQQLALDSILAAYGCNCNLNLDNARRLAGGFVDGSEESQLLKACLTACMQSLYSVCKACVFLFCQSILQDNSCLWIMQADLLKRLMRKDQPPQRRPRQVGFTFMTSHHCS